MHELIASQAAHRGDHIAVAFGEQVLSYMALLQRSETFALYLQSLGVKPNTLVGICVDRSVDMMVGLLGILQAGGAYVPLDPEYPQARLDYMINDSGVGMIITQAHLKPLLKGIVSANTRLIAIDEEWPQVLASVDDLRAKKMTLQKTPRADDLAYVIYTSGSTGQPKAVMISHRSLTNFLVSMARQPGITADDHLLAVTTYCFDIAALELYLPLISGARCSICSSAISKDAARLRQEITAVKPTLMQATPATWTMLFLVGWDNAENIKILCGGEALPGALKQQFMASNSEVWNLFGPTETTIWSTVDRITETRPITIGKPIANTQVYVLDDQQSPVPIGVPGELYIAGDGVAVGYLNRPELTAEKFLLNPFQADGRMYKTGDRVRWQATGHLQFIERLDHQVKIRGYRVELAEIEKQLAQHPDVQESAVVVKNADQHQQLLAYVVAKGDAEIDGIVLRSYLRDKLPDYMLPTAIMALSVLPLTANGKIDRKALMERPLPLPETENKTQSGDIEETSRGIWQRVLKTPDIHTDMGFFEVGGNSILAVVLAEKISHTFECKFDVTHVFQYPTIRDMSNYITGQQMPLDSKPTPPASFTEQSPEKSSTPGNFPDYYQDSLAIIGISCQFPGAQDHREFWQNLCDGKEGGGFFSLDELHDLHVSEAIIQDPDYVPRDLSIADKASFDPAFFSLSPKDAETMDPQFRQLLMHAWHGETVLNSLTAGINAWSRIFSHSQIIKYPAYVTR